MKNTDTATVGDLKQDVDANELSMKEHFLEHSTVKSNGIREVNKAGFDSALLSRGVSSADVKRVQAVLDEATGAAAELAADDLLGKITGASKDDLKNDEFRRGLNATVRIPTPGGNSEITVAAEKSHPIPFRGDADGNGERQSKIVHGGIRTSINTTKRIDKAIPEGISQRIKDALGVK